MGFAIGVVLLVLGLLVAIGLHEIGHMAPAKRFGVKVPQYFIGFGPTLWSTKRGETEYGVKAIPLGGFVRLAGMYPPATGEPRRTKSGQLTMAEEARADTRADLLPGEEHRAFSALPVWKKLVVMFGGPLMNWFLALVLLLVIFVGLGTASLTTRLSAVSECVPEVGVEECAPDAAPAPAAAAGLQPGDVLTAWDGVEVGSWTELTEQIQASGADPVEVTYLRDGTTGTTTLTPVTTERPVLDESGQPVEENGELVTEPRAFAGFSGSIELVRTSPVEAVSAWWNGTGQTFAAVASIPVQLWNTTADLLGFGDGDGSDRTLMSIFGVGQAAGEIAGAPAAEYTLAMRTADMLTLLASLNIALFVFNLIPLPPLDGGHIAGALAEGARRAVARVGGRPDPGPLDTAKLLPVAYAVFFLLMAMTVLLVWADIANPLF